MTEPIRRPLPGPSRRPKPSVDDQALIQNGFTHRSTFRKLAFPVNGEDTFYRIGDPDAGEFADRSKVVEPTIPPFRPRMGYKTTPPPISERAALLREAEGLITGERNQTYGAPTQNFANIAALLNVQFRHKLKDGEQFTPADIAQMQIHTKMARMIAQPKRDNYVDIAGYAACGWEAEETP